MADWRPYDSVTGQPGVEKMTETDPGETYWTDMAVWLREWLLTSTLEGGGWLPVVGGG